MLCYFPLIFPQLIHMITTFVLVLFLPSPYLFWRYILKCLPLLFVGEAKTQFISTLHFVWRPLLQTLQGVSHRDWPRETPLANSCCQSFHPHSTLPPCKPVPHKQCSAKAAAVLLACHSFLHYHFMYAQCRGTLPFLPGTGSRIHPYFIPYSIHSPLFQKLSWSILGCWSRTNKAYSTSTHQPQQIM